MHIAEDGKEFTRQIETYLSKEDLLTVQAAFDLAQLKHRGQLRKSGELFFTHPLTVAYYLSEYHLDAAAVAAALLHDVAEDTQISIDQIKEMFGPEISALVDGVTKLKNVSQKLAKHKQLSKQEIQDASLGKFFGFMIEDVRVVIIKLFDRLHNMRTIEALPAAKQYRKAQETLLVYGPLANRLGIWKQANELAALSLKIVDPYAYQTVERRLKEITQENQRLCDIVSEQIIDSLLAANLDVRNVVMSPENIYTVYQDLSKAGLSYRDVDRTMRLVILMDDWTSCYLAMGHIHHLWKPVPGSFDDYIAFPRDNLYRSLHTTVLHSSGLHIKLRFRTVAMDKVSEIGVLARWLYAGTPLWTADVAERVDAFIENISENINIEPQNLIAGVRGVVEDVISKQIRVYTPRGDVVELTLGATPIDFAYKIHTGIGDQCHAAYVNDKLYPLNKPLKDGDRVLIKKKDKAQPQRTWLDRDLGYIATNYAHYHASRWFRRLTEKTAVRQGRQLLQSELRMIGFPDFPPSQIAADLEFESVTALFYALGRADLLPTAVATRVLEDQWDKSQTRNLDNVVYTNKGEKYIIIDVPTRRLRLCGTCNPRPGDPILGYLRADKSITVHREGCHSLLFHRAEGRILKPRWGEARAHQAHISTILVKVYDRPGLLFEITHLMQERHINIPYINTPPARKGEVYLLISLEVMSARQLVRILHQIYALTNVYAVQRLYEGTPDEQGTGVSLLYLPE